MRFAYILLGLVGAACAVFVLQNKDPVDIQFVTWHLTGMPLGLVILLSVFGGLIFASCLSLLRHWKLRSRIRQLEAQLAAVGRPTVPPPPPQL
jgi:uncharacterized integral membrane protein